MIEVRVGVIVIHDNKLLLVNHFRNGKRYWVLPGGKLRQGEPLQECAEREVEEETSLKVKVTELLFTGETIWPEGKRHIINFFFRGVLQSGEIRKPSWSFPDERLDIPKFVPLEDIDKISLLPDISNIILEIATGKEINKSFLGNLWKRDVDKCKNSQ